MNKKILILLFGMLFLSLTFTSAASIKIWYGRNESNPSQMIPVLLNNIGKLKMDLNLVNLTTGNLVAEGNISTENYGFFGWLGSITNRVTKLFVVDIDASGDVIVGGTLNVTNDIYLNGSKIIFADNAVIINQPSDLPTPTDTGDGLDTAYRLENKMYVFGNNMTLDYPIVGTTLTDETTALTGNNDITINYTGSGGLFRSNQNTSISVIKIEDLRFILSSNATLFNITVADHVMTDWVSGVGLGGLGTLRNVTTIGLYNTIFNNFSSGLIIEDSVVFYSTAGLFSTMSAINDSHIHIRGTFFAAFMNDMQFIPQAGDSSFDIDAGVSGTIDISQINFIDAFGGSFFSNDSLDQTDIKVNVHFSHGVPDSQTIGSFYMERNIVTTTIDIQGELGSITSFSNATLDRTNVTSTGHGLDNGDIVWIINDDYSGKYTIGEVSTNNFLINISFTVDDIGTWETGWTLIAGETIPVENERANMTDNNTIEFYNLEEKKGVANVVHNSKSTLGTVKDFEFCIMKNDIRLRGSLIEVEMKDDYVASSIMAPTSFVAGDEFSAYVRNIEDVADIDVATLTMVIK